MYRVAVLLLSLIALACGDQGTQAGTAPARFLYVWAGDKDEKHSDFLAVVDVREKSRTYGQVIATEPVGMSGTLPHHLEYQLPARGQLLFANGHHHEQIFVFNSDSADRPKLAGRLPAAAPLRYPHDFARLSNGNVLVGYLRSEGASPLPGDTTRPGNHGGIAEFDGQGRLLRTASAAVAGDTIPIRPYAFAVLTDLDLLLTTSAPMMEDASADVIQLWRLSDFQLLRTLPVPHARAANGSEIPDAHRYPFEPRIMRDGSVLLNAFGCGFY